MANHKSSKKRAKQTIKKAMINRRRRSPVRTAMKALRQAITDKNKKVAEELFPKVQALLAKVGKTSAMERKQTSRTTSRLISQINKI